MQEYNQRSRWLEHAERRVGREQLRRALMLGQAVTEFRDASSVKTTLPGPWRTRDSGACS